MNTMQGRMMTVKRDGLPYEEMGYCPPPNRKLPPVPGQHSNYNTIDRIKNGKNHINSTINSFFGYNFNDILPYCSSSFSVFQFQALLISSKCYNIHLLINYTVLLRQIN